jgi:glycine hydroxymethyltransferase
MTEILQQKGFKIVSGGTDNHMFLLDLIDKDITGKDADAILDRAHITVNKNAVPNDPRSPFVTSGLRMGTPAITTRGFGQGEVTQICEWIVEILEDINDESRVDAIRDKVVELCGEFPVYR